MSKGKFGRVIKERLEPLKLFFRKLGIVVWKNLLLRKSQYLVTTLEVLVPLFFLGLMLIIQLLVSPKLKGNPYLLLQQERLKPISEQDLFWIRKAPNHNLYSYEAGRSSDYGWCSSEASNPDPISHDFIAYTPENPKTTEVIKQVADSVCGGYKQRNPGWIPVANESELERMYNEEWGGTRFRAAVIFSDELSQELNQPGSTNGVLSYTIRMKPDDIPDTNLLFPVPNKDSPFAWNDFTRIGPPEEHAKLKYVDSGFLGLQLYMDKVLGETLTTKKFAQEVALKRFPYPPYKKPEEIAMMMNVYIGFLISACSYGVIFMTPSITKNVVGEKMTGVAELLRMSGVSSGIQWTGWLIHAVTPSMITIIMMMVILFAKMVDGGAIFKLADPFLLFILIWLYYFLAAAFVLFLCSLFQKPTIATTVAVTFFNLSQYGVLIYLFAAGLIPLYIRLPLLLIPDVAIATVFMNVAALEQLAGDEGDVPAGARWSNIHLPVPAGFGEQIRTAKDGLSNLQVIMMMLAGTVFYTLLAIYIEGILPSEHGVRRPWYYFRCDHRKKPSRVGVQPPQPPPTESTDASAKSAATVVTVDGMVTTSPGFQAEPEGATVGVDIQSMYKQFGPRKIAVNGVSMRMYSGDIFALLGHNGAGKTTLISMLTGFFAPTSGTAVINGFDIGTDVEKARKAMGLCPQHNMIFERVTVLNHLILFGVLRGLTFKNAKMEANMILARMSLMDKAKILAMNLSGGQKRKLCLAMSLVGGTKVVVLDEPTSGMDPQARREIWDLLLQLRGERTILLTTHFMEEADVLGDRIGIMADGRLQCCGTSSFLKKYYGTGYTLKLTLVGGGLSQQGSSANVPPSPSAEVQGNNASAAAAGEILTAIQKHVPNAKRKAGERQRGGNELFLTLPADTATTSVLSQMFADLTARKDKLGIKTIGLSQTTMDEVFVRVGELNEEMKHGFVDHDGIDWAGFQRAQKLQKHAFMGHFSALLMKKFLHFIRKWGMLIFEILIPLLLMVGVVSGSNSFAEPRTPTYWVEDATKVAVFGGPPLPISIDQYKQHVTYYSLQPRNPDYVKDVIGPSHQLVTSDVSAQLVSVGVKDRKGYKRRLIVAAKMNSGEFRAMFNLFPYHAAPLAINLATNSLLKYSAPDKNYRLHVTNHPFHNPEPGKKPVEGAKSRSGHYEIYDPNAKVNRSPAIPPLVNSVLSVALMFLVTSFIVTPIEERICQAKQLQTMTGVSPLVYWGAEFAWDYVLYLLIIFLMWSYLLIFEYALGYGVLSSNSGWLVLLLIVVSFGIPAILFSYLMSFRSSTVAGGFSLVFIIHVVTGLMFSAIPEPSQLGFMGVGGKVFMVIFYLLLRLFPAFPFGKALKLYSAIAVGNSDCRLLHPELECSEPKPFMHFLVVHKGLREEDIYTPGIGLEVLLMIFQGLLYGGLLMLIEFRMFAKLKEQMCRDKPGAFPPNMNDEDVVNEAQRVGTLVGSRQMGEESLVVHNLCKSFGGFAAVSQLHFGVHYGECFGLLGVNGAGKTTAFRMITGDEIPSLGSVFGFNTSLDKDPSKFFTNIGYCPQFDAILGHFTGKEMLELFAGLRGVPFKQREIQALNWLSRMGLMDSANVKCGKYSGGMKRRLSTAMAMIGDPALILLDEPTSGVDPVSRRQFWRILDKMRESGQSIILTSHSMEECEALCSRIGIMVNGQFQCFGGAQHLKNKFAQGYSLTLNLKPEMAQETDEVKAELFKLHERLSQRFQFCTLKDKHSNLLQYGLNNPSISWDVLFKTMEEIKTEFTHVIEDYAVNEASLEDVFIAFARMQYPLRIANVSHWKKVCTCRC